MKQNPTGAFHAAFQFSAAALLLLPAMARADLIGHWALNEGFGTFAADASPSDNDATILGAAWNSDATRGTFLTFTGNAGSYVNAGEATVPLMDLVNSFTWAFWANRAVGDTELNSVVFGNRYRPTGQGGGDFAPRQFIKFTPTQFEWHMNGNGNDNLDYPDLPGGEWHHHAVVKSGENLTYYLDGVETATRVITQPLDFAQPLHFGGDAATTDVGEFFNGSLDDVRIYDHALTAQEIANVISPPNNPPVFAENPILKSDATIGVAYSTSVAGAATDPDQGDTVTYAKTGGPAWLQMAANGAVTGTPTASDTGVNRFGIQATDGTVASGATLVIRVIDPAAPPAGLFGRWPLKDGSGIVAADLGPNGLDANIVNADTGGLGPNGEVWVDDPECGIVLGFNGDDLTGAYAVVGAPPATGTLPVFALEDDFTWSFRAKSDQAPNNDIILGNRWTETAGVEFVPREFIKFTTAMFEWDTNNVQGVNYDDFPIGVWIHHVIVKAGSDLLYYRDGVFEGIATIVSAPINPQPLFFAGQGMENWRGSLSDVRLFEGALTGAEVLNVFNDKPAVPPADFRITNVALDATRNLIITWNSRAGSTYAVDSSLNLVTWTPVAPNVPSGGTSTSFTLPAGGVPNPAAERALYLRVRE